MFMIFAVSLLALFAPFGVEGGSMSLLGKKICFGAQKSGGPTARSYVQDGLIAMWDGIENAGWGVHDAAATTWEDLVNNKEFTVETGRLTFDSNSHVFVGDTILSSDALLSDKYAAFEFVVSDWTAGTLYVAALNATGNGNSYREVYSGLDRSKVSVCNRNQYTNGWGVEGFSTTGLHTISANFGSVYNADKAFLDGIECQQVSMGSSWMSRGKAYVGGIYYTYGGGYMSFATAHLHCIRLYSRALTAEEVAANFAVDRARFNLPDAT